MFPTFESVNTLRRVKVYENIQVRKISDAPFLPLSVLTVAKFLKWDLAEEGSGAITDQEDDNITMVIGAVRDWWERHTGLAVLRSVWEQVQDAVVANTISIRRGPVIGITTVQTIAGFTPATITPVTMDDELYAQVRNDVYSDNWPSHRGKASVIVRYTAGVVDWEADNEATPTSGEITIAQGLVPYAHRVGMLNAIGHLLENREGAKSTSKYEVDAKLTGLTPPNSELMAVGVSNLSLSGKCWR